MKRSDEAWEAWVREALKGRNLAQPSPGVIRRAIALGGQLAGRSAAGPGAWARLIFDSATQPLPAGVRSAAPAERRLLYELREAGGERETGQLDLRVHRESGEKSKIEIRGQVLPQRPGAVIKAEVGRYRRRLTLDESGEFLLRGVPGQATSISIEIDGPEHESLIIPAIPLLG